MRVRDEIGGTHNIIILILSSAPVTWLNSRTQRDEGEEEHPSPPGQTQGQVHLWLHWIKPIIAIRDCFPRQSMFCLLGSKM